MSNTSATTEQISRPENGNLCFLLGKAFSSPQHFESGHPGSCREMVCGLPPAIAAEGVSLAEEWERAMNDVDPVLLAYSKLFIGPFDVSAPPYASHYLDPGGRLMGEVSTWVAGAYAAAALGPGEGPSEAPDHVALEWEFLYYLSYRSNTQGDPVWAERARAFINDHMIRWVPRLAEAILQTETHPYYRALARFTPRFLEYIGSGDAGRASLK